MKPKNIILVDETSEGLRIDKYLKDKLNLPFSLLHKEFRKKNILINNKKVTGNHRLQKNDKVFLYREFKQYINDDVEQKNIPFSLKKKLKESIVFKDRNFLILNKWGGIASQGGSKVKISIDDLIKLLESENDKPKLVHRLDKDTTGLLIIALNTESARYFHQILSNQKIKKTYYAIVTNKPKDNQGIYTNDISDNKKIFKAQTKYNVIKKIKNNFYLLRLEPLSGRKHQIRLHCYLNNLPILGDQKYNNSSRKLNIKNLFLHAGKLEFNTKNGKKIKIETDLPQHFNEYLN